MKEGVMRFGRLLLLAFAVVGVSSAVFAESNQGSGDAAASVNAVTATGVVCPTALTPVACVNGKTYRNPCEASAASATDCKRVKFPVASARRPVASAAGVYCNMIYSPVVCADGKTFGNACIAKNSGEDTSVCKRIFSEAEDSGVSPTASDSEISEKSSDGIFVQASTLNTLKAQFVQAQAVRAQNVVAFDDDVKASVDSEVSANPAAAPCIRTPVANAKEAGTPAAILRCLKLKTLPAISAAARKDCDDKPFPTARQACRDEIKSSTAAYWKFSFAALISQAESFSTYGVSADEITSFTVFVKEESLAFDKATTADEKKAIVKSVTDAWKEFRKKVLAAAAQQKVAAASTNVATAVDVLVSIQTKLHEKGILTPRLDDAILKLQADLTVIQSTTASLSEKWVAVAKARATIAFAKNAAFKYLNGETVEAFEEPSVTVPVEIAPTASVEASATVAASVSAVATATTQ